MSANRSKLFGNTEYPKQYPMHLSPSSVHVRKNCKTTFKSISITYKKMKNRNKKLFTTAPIITYCKHRDIGDLIACMSSKVKHI